MKVGNLSYGLQSEAVEKTLILDVMDTVKDWLVVLMENYKVMINCDLVYMFTRAASLCSH